MTLQQSFEAPQRRNTTKQQSKKQFFGRKRSFNELKKTQTMQAERTTRLSVSRETEETKESLMDLD